MNQVPPMAFIVSALLLSAIVASAIVLILRYRKVKPALGIPAKETSGPDEKPKSYTYKDFARDLSDESVGISEIIERCRGVAPEAPETEKQGPIGSDGVPSPENAKALQSPPHEPLPGAPTVAETAVPRTIHDTPEDRQQWFAQIAQKVGMVKLVPPPAGQPVIAVKGMMLRCSCKSGISTMSGSSPIRSSSPFRPMSPQPPGVVRPPGVDCEKCNDTGFVIMVGGK